MENINIFISLIYMGMIIAGVIILLKFFNFVINVVLSTIVIFGIYYVISGKNINDIQKDISLYKDKIVILFKKIDKKIKEIGEN